VKRLICVFIFGSLAFGNVSLAEAAAPRFRQCPRVGADTGCQFLINVTNFGSTIAIDSSQPSYANNPAPPPVGTGEAGPLDSLIGVQNNSSVPLTSLNLSGTGSFAFDGDGICNNASGAVPSGCQTPSGSTSCGATNGPCSFLPPVGEPAGSVEPGARPGMPPFPNGDVQNGYEGPGAWFSSVSAHRGSGTVNFSPALAPGSSTYFALENRPALPAAVAIRVVTRASAAGVSGRIVYVPASVSLRETAHLSGKSASHARGDMRFELFRDATCRALAAPVGVRAVSGTKPVSKRFLIRAPGIYHGQVGYSGDGINGMSVSACAAQTAVVPRFGSAGLPLRTGCIAQLTAQLNFHHRRVKASLVFVKGRLIGRFGSTIRVPIPRGRTRIAVIVSSIPNAFARGVTSLTALAQQSRVYRGC
jgi:hypothetical protein